MYAALVASFKCIVMVLTFSGTKEYFDVNVLLNKGCLS